MNRKERREQERSERKLRRGPSPELAEVRVGDLATPDLEEKLKNLPVPLSEREGVWAHSFKCMECRLEFVVFSWKPDRQRVGVTFCPECGRQTNMLHQRFTMNERTDLDPEPSGPTEIFAVMPYGGRGAHVLDDSRLADGSPLIESAGE